MRNSALIRKYKKVFLSNIHLLSVHRRTDTGNVSGKTFQHRDDFLCRRLQHHDDAGCGVGIRRQMMIVQVILEGLGLGILLILVCAVGIRKGAVGIDMHQKSDTYTTTIARESLSN